MMSGFVTAPVVPTPGNACTYVVGLPELNCASDENVYEPEKLPGK